MILLDINYKYVNVKPFANYFNGNASGNKEIFVNKNSYQISRIFLSDYILRIVYVHT